MTVPVTALLLADAVPPLMTPSRQITTNVDFGALVTQGLNSVDNSLAAADQKVRILASGDEIATHDVMISMEEARLSLLFAAEVRNRVVEAYQELSRMQL